ncbi:MAG TPA: FHA domain-containing protein [Candidatus Koribacter sp.]|jgi:pSer/pThr/pTyr-binding forkhead associated (FHA) protein
MARLFLKLDNVVLREYAISEKAVTIGRLSENAIHVDNLSVSGHHARIVPENGQFILYDQNSTNGTYVNGQKVSRATLVNGDTIHVGRHILEFENDPNLPKLEPKLGTLVVLNGKTDAPEYVLDKLQTIIGKAENATVHLQRWFAPKMAAVIMRRDEKYFISDAGSGIPVRVNTAMVQHERELMPGDTILVDEVSMIFNYQG